MPPKTPFKLLGRDCRAYVALVADGRLKVVRNGMLLWSRQWPCHVPEDGADVPVDVAHRVNEWLDARR
jgi:hypothetical protein